MKLLDPLASLLARRGPPKPHPAYTKEAAEAAKSNIRIYRHQILKMYGQHPEKTGVDFEELIAQHPEWQENPLAAYHHIYDNCNPHAPKPDKKIIFLHLQRTAGSTFTHIMRRNVRNMAFRRDFNGMENTSPIFLLNLFYELSPKYQAIEREKWDRYDSFGNHMMYGVHNMLNSPYSYLTILRDPVDRLISLYRLIRDERVHSYSQDDAEMRTAQQLSLVEFIHHPMFHLKMSLEQSCVRMIAGDVPPVKKLGRQDMDGLLARAKYNLSTFDAVLLQERFEESVELACRMYGWKDELYDGKNIVPRDGRVVGHVSLSRNAHHMLTPGEMAAVRDFIKWDIELYEYGKKLFEQQLLQYGITRTAAASIVKVSRRKNALMIKEVPEIGTMEECRTPIGTLDIAVPWAELLRGQKFDPFTFDEKMREAVFEKKLKGDELFDYGSSLIRGDQHIPRIWKLTLHARNICKNVIDKDQYGLRALREKGFNPKIMVDVGAHIGAFSRLAASLWNESSIVAVEPCAAEVFDSSDIHVLRHNLKNIPNAKICKKALIGFHGSANGSAPLEGMTRDSADHWMELGLRGHPEHAKKIEQRSIEASSVAQFLKEYGLERIDLLKLSCDGCETNILHELAALGMLERIDYVCGQWHGDLASKEIPRLLERTHEVEWQDVAPAPHRRGVFRATLLHANK
jgi:FkbM family methyltransferase